MLEDFKDKIRVCDSEKTEPPTMPPEITAKLKEEGLDPKTVTMKHLFPETLNAEGNDLSLMSAAEMEIMINYAKTRRYLLEKYPQSKEEAKMLGQEWAEELGEPYQINVAKAHDDPQSRVFVKTLFQMKTIFDKVEDLQTQATESRIELVTSGPFGRNLYSGNVYLYWVHSN